MRRYDHIVAVSIIVVVGLALAALIVCGIGHVMTGGAL